MTVNRIMELDGIAAVLLIFLSGIANTGCSCSPGHYGEFCEKECMPTCKSCTSEYICDSCKPRHYGPYCSELCNTKCLTCKSNDTCDTCKSGYYGPNCDLNCPTYCKTGTCLHNGSCPQCQSDLVCHKGCPSMCYNNKCDTATGHCYSCKDGYFGKLCNNSCPDTCIACTSFDYCKLCKEGFVGQTCEHHCTKTCRSCKNATNCTLCKDGYFGPTCTETCKNCKGNSTCRQADGVCIGECADGFAGEKCSERCDGDCKICKRYMPNECTTCVMGKYGRPDGKTKACSKFCPDNCFNNNCNEFGLCDKGCKPNFYGLTCEKVCSPNCVNYTCDQEKGVCENGCKDGFYKTDCSGNCTEFDPMCAVCSDVKLENNYNDLPSSKRLSNGLGLAGLLPLPTYNCSKCHTGFYQNKLGQCLECSMTCKGGNCTTNTGHCANGCEDGFWADFCNRTCPNQCYKCMQINGTCTSCVAGQYALNCSQECSTTCKQTSDGMTLCDIITGECVDGCKPGFYGDNCTLDCKERCGNQSCYIVNGACDDHTNIQTRDTNSGKLWIEVTIVCAVILLAGAIVTVGIIRRKRTNDTRKTSKVRGRRYNDNQTDELLEITRPTSANGTHSHHNRQSIASTSRARHLPMDIDDAETAINVLYSDVKKDKKNVDTDKESSRKSTVDKDVELELDDEIYYNNEFEVQKYKIPVDHLADFVTTKNKQYFEMEFKKFPDGLIKQYMDSQKPENSKKNRYKGIYPYDDSRVKLKGLDSDYINANFIDGYRQRHAYIACLGPTVQTMADFSVFWTMVWQQNVEKIVILTNLIENDKPKCDQYWPDKGTKKHYGNIRVECQTEDMYADFVLRSMCLKMEDKQRYIHHFHFTSWPDKCTPDDVTSLIEFRQKVVNTELNIEGPTVVHCSAGVGRTGTYIALDILTKEGESEKGVDIPGCVRNMRQNRTNMVQTAGQYWFLHNAIVHTLTLDSKPIPAEIFPTYASVDNRQQRLTQYQHLKQSKDATKGQVVCAVKKDTTKNRESADIPIDAYRPRLRLRETEAHSDYVNAVYVNSFMAKNRYIVAQTPMSTTVDTFLQLVIQEKCSCIVSMDDDGTSSQDVGIYIPTDEEVTLTTGSFIINLVEKERMKYCTQRTLKLQRSGIYSNTDTCGNESGADDITVRHLHYTDWNPDKTVPTSSEAFIQFIHDVDNVSKNSTNGGPILIHCLSGGGRSGLVCVVSNLIEKLEIEHEISVINTVRQGQFEFCHECVVDFLSTFETYSNFC